MLIPIVANIDFILNLWLAEVPEYTNYFIIFILISYLFNAVGTPFVTSLFATGAIKFYQISLGVTFLMGLIIVFLALYLGAEPYSVSVVAIFIQFILLLFRLYFTHKHVEFSYKQFGTDVLIPIIVVTILSILPAYLLKEWSTNIWQIILSMTIEISFTGLLILLIGMSRGERDYIIKSIKQKI